MSNTHRKVNAQSVYYSLNTSYPMNTFVSIKKKDFRGRVKEINKIPITHTNPLLCVSEDLSMMYSVWGSSKV
jgi:hypothetical protein